MSFSDKSCYLGLESDPTPFAGISLGLFCSQLSPSGECPPCLLQIHEDGSLGLMVSCGFALRAAVTLGMQELFRLGRSSRSSLAAPALCLGLG